MPAADKRSLPSFNTLLDFVYPSACLHCGCSIRSERKASRRPALWEGLFCSVCWAKVRRLEGVRCPHCAIPFSSQFSLSHSPGHRCGDCREDPPLFSRAITPFLYEETLAKAVQALKYRQQKRVVLCLASLLFDDLDQIKSDLVLAIPLHLFRLRAREFNQSLLIAKEVSRHLRCPLGIDVMQRVRETLPQVGLSKKERRKNIHRAFRVVKPQALVGKRILLIDDVYTTGATLKEGAKTLMKSGAREVIVAAPTRMVL